MMDEPHEDNAMLLYHSFFSKRELGMKDLIKNGNDNHISWMVYQIRNDLFSGAYGQQGFIYLTYLDSVDDYIQEITYDYE